jgi:hypothetical protein
VQKPFPFSEMIALVEQLVRHDHLR